MWSKNYQVVTGGGKRLRCYKFQNLKTWLKITVIRQVKSTFLFLEQSAVFRRQSNTAAGVEHLAI